MNPFAPTTARRLWWRRFHPLVRLGWYTATRGQTRPAAQTAIGFAMMGAGVLLRRSQKSKNKPIYTHVASEGQTTRIRVYRGTAAPTETTIRT